LNQEEKRPPNQEQFKWNELLGRIKRKAIIPVIGHGLYWIQKEGKGEFLLYDYLAEKLIKEFNIDPPPGANHKFFKVTFE
jgi:hypothetical protein